jgi:hypothetical protein
VAETRKRRGKAFGFCKYNLLPEPIRVFRRRPEFIRGKVPLMLPLVPVAVEASKRCEW